MNRPTLLVISDAVVPTGFSRVVRGVLDPLLEHYDIHQLGVSYNGDPHDWPWKIYPAGAGGDVFGGARLPWLFDKVKPDLIFMVSNLARVNNYMGMLADRGKEVPIVVYTAVEAEPVDETLIPGLREIDRLVFYTEFAKQAFENALELQEDETLKDAFTLSSIPHGVDTSIFFPMEPEVEDRQIVKRRAKEKLFRGNQEHTESFVVLNANRNEPRKRIDTTIKGFAEFARDKDKFVKLHLHMGAADVGWDVVRLSKRFGIYDRLIMTNRRLDAPDVDLEEMNLIYNAADVGMNTSSGEGWGLVSFEHAATRTAQLVPKHASLDELWTGTAEMVEPTMTLCDHQLNCDLHLLSPEGVAAGLEKLYDLKHRHEVADRCYAYATQPALNWEIISRGWGMMFRELLEQKTKTAGGSPPAAEIVSES